MTEQLGTHRLSPQVDANAKEARNYFKKIIERFANGHSLDPMMRSFAHFSQHVQHDFEFRNYLQDLRTFVYNSSMNKDYIEHQDWDLKANELIRKGRMILGSNYQDDTSTLVGQMNDFMTAMNSDELTNRFAEDARRINRDLFFNRYVS